MHAVSTINEVQRLTFGVREADKALFKQVQSGKVKISSSEGEALIERLGSPVTHYEVVKHAISKGLKVPKSIRSEYGL